MRELRALTILAVCWIQLATSQNTSIQSAVYYTNSTTFSTVVPFPAVNANVSGQVNTLLPQTNVSAQIIQFFANQLNLTSSPGGALLITTPNNGTLCQSFGTQGLGNSQPFRLDNHFRIASNTKTFTASALLKLVSEGRLSLNDVSHVDGTYRWPSY